LPAGRGRRQDDDRGEPAAGTGGGRSVGGVRGLRRGGGEQRGRPRRSEDAGETEPTLHDVFVGHFSLSGLYR
jgi:hypothetical protein